MSWFIEAWSVIDGYAFAAHRNYTFVNAEDEAADRRAYIDPDDVVFLGPPHFVPAPARYATALAATRGPFQDGFAGNEGDDVRFESLPQIVELVRRAYVAGGANLPGPPGETDVDRAQPPSLTDGIVSEREETQWQDWLQRAARVRAANDRMDLVARFHSINGGALLEGLMRFCQWTRDELVRTLPSRQEAEHSPELDVLVWESIAIEVLGGQAHRVLGPFGWRVDPYWPVLPSGLDLENAVLGGLLHRIPSPAGHGRYGSLNAIGQHLCAALSDRNYLMTLTSLEDAIPLLMGAFAIAAARSWAGRTGTSAFGDLVRARGIHWLAKQLPDNALDGIPAATDAITEVLERSRRRSP